MDRVYCVDMLFKVITLITCGPWAFYSRMRNPWFLNHCALLERVSTTDWRIISRLCFSCTVTLRRESDSLFRMDLITDFLWVYCSTTGNHREVPKLATAPQVEKSLSNKKNLPHLDLLSKPPKHGRCCKHAFEILVHINLIGFQRWCSFVSCMFMLWISDLNLLIWWLGRALKNAESLSCSRNQLEMTFACIRLRWN